jgi:hypothetical protein
MTGNSPAEGGLEILVIHHAIDRSVADHRLLTYNLDKPFIKEIICNNTFAADDAIHLGNCRRKDRPTPRWC